MHALGSARGSSRACGSERVLAIANFVAEFFPTENSLEKDCFVVRVQTISGSRQAAETYTLGSVCFPEHERATRALNNPRKRHMKVDSKKQ